MGALKPPAAVLQGLPSLGHHARRGGRLSDRQGAQREQGLVERPLSNATINHTLKVLAQVLDVAVEYGCLETNSARGKRRRLKAAKPRRTWLELTELRAILDAAGEYRALLATMALAGLRVGETTSLRWHDVDLARGRLHVAEVQDGRGRSSWAQMGTNALEDTESVAQVENALGLNPAS